MPRPQNLLASGSVEDLSLHVLDIAENSIRARSRRITVSLLEDRTQDVLTLRIADDGDGMTERERHDARGPFFTTKAGKRTGLGLSLLAQAAEEAGGHLSVDSRERKGTTVTATFRLSHVDRKPLGDIQQTMTCLKATHPEIAFDFNHSVVE